MRRFVSFLILSSIAVLTVCDAARADGLYVGHGRRTQLPAWSARLNLSGGLHGASDPFRDDLYDRYHWYEFGGYGSIGLEIHTGYGNSVELYGLYRAVEDTGHFVDYYAGGPGRVASRYDIEAYSFGATLRHYEVRGHGGGYVGVGGGFVQSDATLQEFVDGDLTYDLDTSDEGAEIHGLVGFEGRFARGVMVGLEIGYRHAFLDDPDDFSGAILGLRMSLLLGDH